MAGGEELSMKLAEALLLRSQAQNKLHELFSRLSNNVIVQEGDTPAEDPRALMAQADEALRQLQELMTRINLTNAALVCDGETMTAMLSRRECLKQELNSYRSMLDVASSLGRRVRGSEIRLVSTVPVAELQKRLDEKSAQLRRLELRIQELNWTSELVE